MKTRIIAAATVLLALVTGSVKADGLKMQDLTLNVGTQATIEVTLEQDVQKYAGLQFDLQLPTGLLLDDHQLQQEQTGDMVCSKRVQDDGTVRFIVYSPTLSTAKAGTVMTLRLKADKKARTGNRELRLKSVILTDAEGIITRPADATATVTFAAPIKVTAKSVSRDYGEQNGTLEYEISESGIGGTPVISCDATPSSPVGTYDIVIEKGTIEADTVTLFKGTLTVTKAPLTITAKSLTKKQGEENPELVAVYEGFKNGETEEVLTRKPTLRTNARTNSALGEYEITVSGASAKNYDITYQKGTLTVTEADAVKVTAKSYTRIYGAENPAFAYEVEGAALDGQPEISCEATATSPVGTYPIIIKKGGVKNYNDSYVDGVLTITKAPLTISVDSYTKRQYDAMPEFVVCYEGFVNGETETVLRKLPTVSCEAEKDSQPGEYVITMNGAEAGNYEISYVAGKLTILEPDGISNVTLQKPYIVRICSVGGKPRKRLHKGVNIVVMSNGTTRTVLIK